VRLSTRKAVATLATIRITITTVMVSLFLTVDAFGRGALRVSRPRT
jgi:hypothetical protein